MTDREIVLDALASGEAFGLELAQRILATHKVVFSPGRLYPLLRDLEDEGVITSEERDGWWNQLRGRRPRVYYRIKEGRTT